MRQNTFRSFFKHSFKYFCIEYICCLIEMEGEQSFTIAASTGIERVGHAVEFKGIVNELAA